MKIKSFHIKKFRQKTELTYVQLGKLLNVTPLTVKRWENSEEPDPTSTAFLVLIPLLLSAGIEILPEPDESAIALQMALLRNVGISEEKLNSENAKRQIRRAAALTSSSEVAASRALFKALSDAWAKIDGVGNGNSP